MTADELRERLDAHCGREGAPLVARDPVNQPMIRHWCDAVGDRNPCYTDPDFASRSVHGGIVAPPTMLQAWTMPGLVPPETLMPRRSDLAGVLRLLDDAGYTSVVATNSRQEYLRYLAPGDLISVTALVDRVSDEKQTALGPGRFVDELMIYRDAAGEEVARMRWRILKFKPPQARGAAAGVAGAASGRSATTAAPTGPVRPRPSTSPDNAFFWEGVDKGELRIQRCTGCSRLRHPPGPMCPDCHGLEWDHVVSCGRGRVHSFVVAHHPPIPPFEYPNLIVLVELEEGTRLVSNLLGVDPADAEIGMPVEVAFTRVDEELVLPLFRPTAPGR